MSRRPRHRREISTLCLTEAKQGDAQLVRRDLAISVRVDEAELAFQRIVAPALVWVFRIINMILCVMMAATGAIGIKNMRYEFLGDLVPLYIIALAALWFCYEVNTIRPCPPITGLYKRNFGFFYNALGKALFIIFMGLLNFGVEAGALGIITAIAVAVDGGLLILLFLKYPHMYPKD